MNNILNNLCPYYPETVQAAFWKIGFMSKVKEVGCNWDDSNYLAGFVAGERFVMQKSKSCYTRL